MTLLNENENQPDTGQEQETTPAEKRINVLTKKFREEERKNGQLQAQMDMLVSQNQTLMQRMDQLAQPKGTAPVSSSGIPDEPLNDFFGQNSRPVGSVQTRQSGISPEQVQDIVKSAVAESLKPFQEQREQDQRLSALRQQQLDSFNEAADIIPDVRQPGSQAQVLFDEIIAGNPGLEMLPNAPALVINAIAGLQQVKHATATQDQRKQIASSPVPSPSLDLTPRIQDGNQTQERQTAQLKDALLSKGRGPEGLDHTEQEALVGILLGRAKAK